MGRGFIKALTCPEGWGALTPCVSWGWRGLKKKCVVHPSLRIISGTGLIEFGVVLQYVPACLKLYVDRVMTKKLMAQLNKNGLGDDIGFKKMALCKIIIGNCLNKVGGYFWYLCSSHSQEPHDSQLVRLPRIDGHNYRTEGDGGDAIIIIRTTADGN